MFVIFNRIGLAMVVLGMIVMYGLWWLIYLIVGDSRYLMVISIAAGVLTMAVADLVYRTRSDREKGWLRYIYPTTGGSLFFLPVWSLSLTLGGEYIYSTIKMLP